jgi:hypothetical protein
MLGPAPRFSETLLPRSLMSHGLVWRDTERDPSNLDLYVLFDLYYSPQPCTMEQLIIDHGWFVRLLLPCRDSPTVFELNLVGFVGVEGCSVALDQYMYLMYDSSNLSNHGV